MEEGPQKGTAEQYRLSATLVARDREKALTTSPSWGWTGCQTQVGRFDCSLAR